MMIRKIKRILKRISAYIIQKKIISGKVVCFESPLEEIAFKYIPGDLGKPGKYFAKYYRQNEFEIDSDSSSVDLAVNEGRVISRHKYDRYHLIEGDHWNRGIKNTATYKSVGN